MQFLCNLKFTLRLVSQLVFPRSKIILCNFYAFHNRYAAHKPKVHPNEICRDLVIWCSLMWLVNGWYLPISCRVASLALGQSYDCPSASEATLNDMGKWIIWDHFDLMIQPQNAQSTTKYSLRIKRRPEALGHQKLSRASKFSFRASKFFFFFMFKNLERWVSGRQVLKP